MSVNVGSASVTIMPTMSGFAAKMDKELGGAGKTGGSAFSKAFGTAAQPGSGFLGRFRTAGNSAGSAMGESVGKGISAKGAAIAGAMGGLASSIGAKLVGTIQGLTGEITDASDSAQKFASTLSFADIDDSTIRQLTASTQAYADETVYDLSDIRNTTAQLAANGVDDYARLAEAAGNLNAVAGGNADTFKSVAMVMTQTAGAGKLTTENWNQLSDAIPGASGKLQEALRANGAYTGNFREALEKGQVSAEEFNRAVMDLGMTDAAKEAATSTATIEGAMGNLEAAGVKGGMVLTDAFKPFITGAINTASETIGQVTDGVVAFFDVAQSNGAVQQLTDMVGALGGAAGNILGALGSLALAVLGIQPSGDAATDAANGLKGALDAAQPVVQGVSDATGWLRDHAAEAAPYVQGLAFAFAAMRAAQGIAGFVTAFSAAVGGVSVTAPAATAGTTALAGGETAAGTAAGVSAAQMLAFGAAVLMVGAGVLLAAAGMLVIATAAIQVASAGPMAAAGMLAMVGAVAGLAVGAAALGPALTAGAVGMLAFGGAVALVGAGVLLASAGLTLLGAALPGIAAYGATAAVGVLALGAAMLVLGPGAIVAAAGLTTLGAGVAVAAAGVTLLAAGAMLLGAGLALVAASVVGASAGIVAMGAAMPMVSSSAPGAAAGLGALAAAALAASPGLLAAVPAMGAFSSACSTASSASSQARSGIDQVKFASQSMATAAKASFRDFANSARGAASTASNAVMGACRQMSAEVGSLRLTLPRIQVGALPHFSMSGRFDAQSGSVPSVSVNWYKSGGVFAANSPQLIGVGDNRRYDEAVVPLSPSVLRGIGEGIGSTGGDSSDVIAWLERNLPAIIQRYTPVTLERDLDRHIRTVMAGA
ncbi:tape measure protein [Parolsenella catena]|jgi:tape measure domain-containing protein|uniref:tape measure protein n=1 Tax=Parolsenella catena TaxID=2003188 RepID=UPI00206825CD|nr:MAG TPA: tail tape measure [Caudoviricetes sp.]